MYNVLFKKKVKISGLLLISLLIVYGSFFLLKKNISFHYDNFSEINDNIKIHNKYIYIEGFVGEILNCNELENIDNHYKNKFKDKFFYNKKLCFEILGKNNSSLKVIVPDNKLSNRISFLFRKGQGVVLSGELNSNKIFIAEKLIIKHNEVYKNR